MSRPTMQRIDALSTVAFCLLSRRGQAVDPTMNEISTAVVQSASLLDIDCDDDASEVELQAVDKLRARHGWKTAAVVKLNGYQHTLANKPKPVRPEGQTGESAN